MQQQVLDAQTDRENAQQQLTATQQQLTATQQQLTTSLQQLETAAQKQNVQRPEVRLASVANDDQVK